MREIPETKHKERKKRVSRKKLRKSLYGQEEKYSQTSAPTRQLNTISHRRQTYISTFVDQTHIQSTRLCRKTVFSKLVFRSILYTTYLNIKHEKLKLCTINDLQLRGSSTFYRNFRTLIMPISRFQFKEQQHSTIADKD